MNILQYTIAAPIKQSHFGKNAWFFQLFPQKKRDGRLPVSPYVLAGMSLALDLALLVDRDHGSEVFGILLSIIVDGDLAVKHIGN